MKALLRRLHSDPYTRQASLFFIGSMFVAGLNYLRYPLLSRVLPIESFGEVQVLLALFSEISMALTGFTLATIHASANSGDREEHAAIVAFLKNASLVTVGVLFVVVIIGAQFFAGALHFSSPAPFFLLGLMLLMSSLFSTRSGYLQGQQKFGTATLANSITSGGGLVFVGLFSWLGWKAAGAIGGIVAGQCLGTLFIWLKTHHALKRNQETAHVLTAARKRAELWHVAGVLSVVVFITLLYTADVIIVKRYFPAAVAGLYSGVSTVANIVMFVSAPLIGVMVPLIKRSHSLTENRQGLKRGLLGVLAAGGGVCLVFVCIPELVVKLLMGAKYVPYAFLLRYLVCAFFLVALTNVFVMFGLALRRYRLTIIAACDIVLFFVLAVTRHASLEQIAQNFVLTGAVALMGTLLLLKKDLFPPSTPIL